MNTLETSSTNSPRLKRIQGAGRILSILFFTIAMMCASATNILLAVSIFASNVPRAELMAGAVNEATATFLSMCCYKLFARYARGELFTAGVVSSIRRIGYAYILMVLAGAASIAAFVGSPHSPNIVWHPITSISIDNGWPIHFFTLAFSGALPAFLIIFIAWVIDEGRKMREEQELIV